MQITSFFLFKRVFVTFSRLKSFTGMTSAHAASTHTRAASILSSGLFMASSVWASAARSDQERQGGVMGRSKWRLLIFAAGYCPTPILSPPRSPSPQSCCSLHHYKKPSGKSRLLHNWHVWMEPGHRGWRDGVVGERGVRVAYFL